MNREFPPSAQDVQPYSITLVCSSFLHTYTIRQHVLRPSTVSASTELPEVSSPTCPHQATPSLFDACKLPSEPYRYESSLMVPRSNYEVSQREAKASLTLLHLPSLHQLDGMLPYVHRSASGAFDSLCHSSILVHK